MTVLSRSLCSPIVAHRWRCASSSASRNERNNATSFCKPPAAASTGRVLRLIMAAPSSWMPSAANIAQSDLGKYWWQPGTNGKVNRNRINLKRTENVETRLRDTTRLITCVQFLLGPGKQTSLKNSDQPKEISLKVSYFPIVSSLIMQRPVFSCILVVDSKARRKNRE